MNTVAEIAFLPLRPRSDELIVLDAERRLYVGLSRDGLTYHVITPARLEDPRVGDGKVHAGDLVCTCPAGMFHARCYRTVQAEAFEGRRPSDGIVPGQVGMREELPVAAMAPGELAEIFGL